MYKIIFILLATIASLAIGQSKYALREQTLFIAGLEYARLDQTTIGGIQLAFTAGGRNSFGIGFSVTNSPYTTRALGFFGTLGLAKPADELEIGVDLLLSFAFISQRVNKYNQYYQDGSAPGNSESVGLDFYLPTIEQTVIPFIQVSRSFSAISLPSTTVRSAGNFLVLGSDFVFRQSDRPWVILTPGVILNKDQRPTLAVDLSFVISSSFPRNYGRPNRPLN